MGGVSQQVLLFLFVFIIAKFNCETDNKLPESFAIDISYGWFYGKNQEIK